MNFLFFNWTHPLFSLFLHSFVIEHSRIQLIKCPKSGHQVLNEITLKILLAEISNLYNISILVHFSYRNLSQVLHYRKAFSLQTYYTPTKTYYYYVKKPSMVCHQTVNQNVALMFTCVSIANESFSEERINCFVYKHSSK